MIDRTPEEWRDCLLKVLNGRRWTHRRLRGYYDGLQPLPTAPTTANDTYRRLARLGVTNMCGLVVNTVNQRLIPTGVRLSENGDADLGIWRRIWQANNLDADWSIAQREALIVGRCPVLVWPSDDGVSVSVEDPDEVAVAYAPGSRRKRIAALKTYTDGETEFVTVWSTVGTVAVQQSWLRGVSRTSLGDAATTGFGVWIDDDDNTGLNPLGRVPVVELLSNPNVKGVPTSELSESVLDLQNRVNKTMFDAVVSSEFGSFPLRYTIGIEIRRDPVTGVPINPLTIGPNRILSLEAQDGNPGQIGQLAPFPLGDLLQLADASIKHFASVSQTPVYHLLSGLSNIGGDTIRAAETGHVAKIIGHQTTFGEAGEEIIRLALIAEGDTGSYPDIEMSWAQPETRSPAEIADAAIKLSQAGYSTEAVLRYAGETPSEIARILSERAAARPAAPAPAPPAPVVAPAAGAQPVLSS